jgi:hypothetical protein
LIPQKIGGSADNRGRVWRLRVAKDRQPQDEKIKVTDKRIFTADGEIRDDFQQAEAPPTAASEPPPAPAPPVDKPDASTAQPGADRRRKLADMTNPDSPFTNFIESLIAQTYMSLGMLRNPYQPQPTVDAPAARQIIDIITMLQQKTRGNLTPEEESFLTTHLGELKLAFVQITKTI